MKNTFDNRTVLVTGGASGIGKAIAQHFLNDGASVIVFDISKPNYTVTYERVDISDEQAITTAIKHIDHLDLLINNAGIYVEGALETITAKDIDAIVGVNLKGAILMCKHAMPLLTKSNGHIINISSMLASCARPSNFLYPITKNGLVLLTEALAKDYARTGVRVNAILPGPISNTNIHPDMDWTSPERIAKEIKKRNVPLGRFGTPDEVASLVAYVASDAGAYIHGASLVIDGGRSIAERK